MRSSHFDPLYKIIDDFITQLLLGWHLKLFVFIFQYMNNQTFVQIVRNNGWASPTTTQQVFVVVQAKIAFLLFFSMTFVAVARQYGSDLFLEEYLASFVIIIG